MAEDKVNVNNEQDIETKEKAEKKCSSQCDKENPSINAVDNENGKSHPDEKSESHPDKTEEKPDKKSCEELLKEQTELVAKLKDQLLRQMAEFDNYKKRTLKEKTELILNGGQRVLESMLPVLDDMERAQQNIAKSNEIETLKEGVELILSKLTKTLASQGLKKMDTKDAVFDTDYHEAVALIPAEDDKKKNHVIDCIQPGYMLNDKVLRHAKVVVGK